MNRTAVTSIAVFLMAAFVAFGTYSLVGERSRANEEQSAGGGWEYLVVQGGNVNLSPSDGGNMRKEPGAFSREWFPVERNLDKLGAKGWELITVSGSPSDPIFYFKRRK